MTPGQQSVVAKMSSWDARSHFLGMCELPAEVDNACCAFGVVGGDVARALFDTEKLGGADEETMEIDRCDQCGGYGCPEGPADSLLSGARVRRCRR